MKPQEVVGVMDEPLRSMEIPVQKAKRRFFLARLLDTQSAERKAELSRLYNSGTLILGRVASSGLGYLTWLITARLFDANEVGVASGIVSAMMLCVQIALFGIGAAVIKVYPSHLDQPSKLINSALNLIGLSSLSSAIIFLAFARVFFNELNIVAAVPQYAILFLAINLFGAINVLMDHVSIAIKRGDQVLSRNIIFGLTTIIFVAGLPLITASTTSIAIVSAWAAAGLFACVAGAIQLKKSIKAFHYSPSISKTTSSNLISIALPNYLLTLVERAPNWILPILITELMTPVDNARWYAVWMMAWVVFQVPISIGQNLFAEIAANPVDYNKPFKHSLRTSLLVGSAAALAMVVLASAFLSLLGRDYAVAGATPLRILAAAILPITFIQMYYAICRGTNRLKEASITGLIAGITGILGAVYAGPTYGLTGMAIVWLVTQSVAAVWAGIRSSSILKQSQR